MDAGPRSRAVVGLPWLRATLAWMACMLAETLHGIVRELFIAPVMGDLRARQLGVLIGSALILLVAWALAGWMKLRRPQWWAVGAWWVLLTVVFELALGRALGYSWQRIFSDYNPAQGGFMLFGLLVLFYAPWLTRRR